MRRKSTRRRWKSTLQKMTVRVKKENIPQMKSEIKEIGKIKISQAGKLANIR